MAGKPGLPRPESVGAGSCWKGVGLGDWGEGRETPALLAVLGGEDELHFTEPGVGGKGMRQERLAGEMGPTSVPSFILF